MGPAFSLLAVPIRTQPPPSLLAVPLKDPGGVLFDPGPHLGLLKLLKHGPDELEAVARAVGGWRLQGQLAYGDEPGGREDGVGIQKQCE